MRYEKGDHGTEALVITVERACSYMPVAGSFVLQYFTVFEITCKSV